MMDTVNEGSTFYLTVSFYDKMGALAQPSGVTWEAIDVGTGTVLKTATALTPGTSIEITVPPSVNAIVTSLFDVEKHRIIIKASYGVDDAVNDQYDYWVTNLSKVPVT